jgi:hypothetical protein
MLIIFKATSSFVQLTLAVILLASPSLSCLRRLS